MSSNGATTLLDCWTLDYNPPRLDTSISGRSDVTLISGTQIQGTTILVFSRPLNTGDSRDFAITGSALYFLWAWGTSDGFGTVFAQHFDSGASLVTIPITQPITTTTNAVEPTSNVGSTTSTTPSSLPITATTASIGSLFPQTLLSPIISSPDDGVNIWWTVNQSAGTITFTLQGTSSHFTYFYSVSCPIFLYSFFMFQIL